MKSEKVLGLLACALACTISGSAFANTTNSWFGVKPTGTDIGLASVTTNGVAVTVENSCIQIDGDSETALTFTPTVADPALNDGLVTITSSAVLTPSDASDLVPVDGAHAGFAVAVDGSDTNFYGYASAGGTGNGPAWIKLNGAPSNPEEATTFTIALNYRDSKVSFYQGDTLLTDGTASEFNISNDFSRLSYVSAYGSGAISSVTSQYEVAVAAYNDKKYGSVADALAAGGATSTIKDVSSSGEISANSNAANGLPVAVCKVLGLSTTEENTAAVAIVPVANDTDATGINFTLAPNVIVESGVAVKFAVKKDGAAVTGSPFASDAIKIPLSGGTGVYTIEPSTVEAAASN